MRHSGKLLGICAQEEQARFSPCRISPSSDICLSSALLTLGITLLALAACDKGGGPGGKAGGATGTGGSASGATSTAGTTSATGSAMGGATSATGGATSAGGFEQRGY